MWFIYFCNKFTHCSNEFKQFRLTNNLYDVKTEKERKKETHIRRLHDAASQRLARLWSDQNVPDPRFSRYYWSPLQVQFNAQVYVWVIDQVWFQDIYVICRLGGPYSEKLWPRSWKCCPRPQAEGSIFKTEVTVFHYTDRPKPVNNLFIFFLSLKRLCLLTGKNSRKRYCDRGQR